ncbi:MAG TPA: DUF448 domain-containing protein [Candidatus Cloacimonetes bacterium]|nr:DUF448 domain-containing protein [Candidatus Cloacimonadota bacterium]
MPNKSSNAGHIPIRTCVVCRSRMAQGRLLSFISQDGGICFDPKRILPTRKHYVCPVESCVSALPKWQKRRLKVRGKK